MIDTEHLQLWFNISGQLRPTLILHIYILLHLYYMESQPLETQFSVLQQTVTKQSQQHSQQGFLLNCIVQVFSVWYDTVKRFKLLFLKYTLKPQNMICVRLKDVRGTVAGWTENRGSLNLVVIICATVTVCTMVLSHRSLSCTI